MLREYCKEKGVALNECGTLVVSKTKEEEIILYSILGMGNEAGVKGLRIINKEELNEKEPKINGNKALFSPNGAIVNSRGLLETVVEEAKQLGAEFIFNENVVNIKNRVIITEKNEYKAEHIINCAGLYADKIAHLMGIALDCRIIPFRGEYKELKNAEINSMVYQPPDLRYPFLGVHLTKTIDNKVIAGPNAMLSLGRESYEKQINFEETIEMLETKNFWNLLISREFLKLLSKNAKTSFFDSAFIKEIKNLYPSAKEDDILPYKAGIRAQVVNREGKMIDDMRIYFEKNSTHVLNVVSPGMTSSFAFAEYVINKIKNNALSSN